MPFTEQVRLFALKATAIMAVHGNALGNAFWLPYDSLVIELHQKGEGSQVFEHLYNDSKSGKLGHRVRYTTLKCTDDECTDNGQTGFNSNVKATIPKLEKILDEFW